MLPWPKPATWPLVPHDSLVEIMAKEKIILQAKPREKLFNIHRKPLPLEPSLLLREANRRRAFLSVGNISELYDSVDGSGSDANSKLPSNKSGSNFMTRIMSGPATSETSLPVDRPVGLSEIHVAAEQALKQTISDPDFMTSLSSLEEFQKRYMEFTKGAADNYHRSWWKRQVAQSSRAAYNFAPLLAEWITTSGAVSPETALTVSEECDKMLRMGDQPGRPGFDRKKLLIYAIICGCRRQIDRLLKDLPTLFNTIEDFLWLKLSALREYTSASSSDVLNEGLHPYTLEDLQNYLNKFEPSYYIKSGKDPLVYPYVLFLSIQLLPAILYLSKEVGEEGYHVDAVHISIALADHGVLPDGVGSGQRMGVMDACAEAASIIRQYGSIYLRNGHLDLALEYYAQAAAAMGGGEVSWIGQGNSDQQRQRSLMLKQLLTEILLRDGGIQLLLGPSGMGEEGELKKYMMDWRSRQQFLLEAAHRCQEAGLYDKSVEIHKRVGAFAMALQTINKCLSDAICAMARSMLDGESRAAALIHSGNEILETARYSSEASVQDKDLISEQQTVLRQLEAILHIYRLARAGQTVDALREIIKLPFLHLDPQAPNVTVDVFRNLSPHVQACVPDLLKVALNCMDNVRDTDGTLRAVKSKIANLVASNMSRNWPQDLYQKVAQCI